MIIRAILRFVMRIAFRMQVEGKDNVPSQGGVILAANHLSMLDPIVVGCAIDRPVRFMAKRELFDNPLLRMLARSLGAFPVRRGKDDKDAFRRALEVLRNDEVLGIFPEGTRSLDGRLQRAYSGAAVLATLGTALTKEQAETVSRYAPQVKFSTIETGRETSLT
jgi:1-acyl-sn-glycerol-3-phosphate acyltransferase